MNVINNKLPRKRSAHCKTCRGWGGGVVEADGAYRLCSICNGREVPAVPESEVRGEYISEIDPY